MKIIRPINLQRLFIILSTLCFLHNSSDAQDTIIQPKIVVDSTADKSQSVVKFVHSLGYGKMINYSDYDLRGDGYYELGSRFILNQKFNLDALFHMHLTASGNSFYQYGPKLQFGYNLSDKFKVSSGFHYAMFGNKGDRGSYSINLNLDYYKNVGFHIKYNNVRKEMPARNESIAIGIHLNGKPVTQVLKVAGGVALIMGVLFAIYFDPS